MKLEDQVCSLELAKKLKQLGVAQKSVFQWASTTTTDETSEYGLRWIHEIRKGGIIGKDGYSAFTVAELGEMLPWMINNDSPPYYLEAHKIIQTVDIDEWEIVYARSNYPDLIHKRADTEADARAKMLIYLLENKLIN